jgi:hypothetical protein
MCTASHFWERKKDKSLFLFPANYSLQRTNVWRNQIKSLNFSVVIEVLYLSSFEEEIRRRNERDKLPNIFSTEVKETQQICWSAYSAMFWKKYEVIVEF